MPVSAEDFLAEALQRVEMLRRTQMDRIRAAAQLLSRSLAAGGVVHIFGTGHSHALGMELARRAGGLVPMNIISLLDLCTRGGEPWTVLEDRTLERDPAVAQRVLATHRLHPADAFIIASHSGRNGAVVEMALQAKSRGLPLVAVTSMAHSGNVTSRHPSGRRLFELADVVIDNCAPMGDALLTDPRLEAPICSVSSITGGFVAQALTAEIACLLLAQGQVPPVLISANVDNSDERNRALLERYAGRISTYP